MTTDAAEIERIELAVSANLLPTWEARIQEGSDQYLSVGRQGKQRFRCLTRSRGGEGLPAPESLKASSPLTASFAAPASEVAGDDGVIETTREVEVVIPADSEPGEKRGEVLVQWPDGAKRALAIAYEVRPLLRATPSAFLLKEGSNVSDVEVLVESDDQPIRILEIRGRGISGKPALPEQSSGKLRVKLELDPALIAPERTAEIDVVTDHPLQPILHLSALVSPRAKEAP